MRELLIYRKILKDKVIKKIDKSSLDKKHLFDAAALLIHEASEKKFCGNILKQYLYHIIKKDENIFTVNSDLNRIDENISIFASKDIKNITEFIEKSTDLFEKAGINLNFESSDSLKKDEFYNILENKDICKITDDLIKYHYKNGSGVFTESSTFKWSNGNFYPVKNIDYITFDDISGYEYQKSIVFQNTKSLSEGKKANNVLLTGARGTGKSSCVKASLNKFSCNGLKLLEITRDQISDLGLIMDKLSKTGRKFIVFIDDISFESFETGYKQIKSILDGGVEKKPDNVVIYATSNRRHIVKESFSEREGLDEVRMSDAVNEKLSLADRFGITIHFMSPTQVEYLEMVYKIAEKENLKYDRDYLKAEAIKWEINQNGRSGRTARQFIDYLLSLD